MVAVSNKREKRNLKFIYIASIFGCFIFWVTVYTPSLRLSDSLEINDSIITDDEYRTDDNFISSSKSTLKNNTILQEKLCTPTTFNQGKWVYDPLDIENPQNATQIANVAGYHCIKKFAHRCFRRSGDEALRAKQIMDYRWQSDSCKLLKMDTKQLADHFLKHPILFVGDSITQLQFESLGCLLGNHFPNRHPSKSDLNGGNTKIKISELAAPNRDKPSLAYIRSDYLLRLDDYKMISPFEQVGSQLGRGENYPWVHALEKFDYVIINTGPHWHPNLQWGPNESEEELLAAFKKAMTVVLDYLKKNVKLHQRVWIRTTPYGHAQCSKYKEPQLNPLAPTGKTGEYEWHLFKEFDLIWKELLNTLQKEGKTDPRFDMLDIATLSNQRGDAHSKPDADCLHTCIPGPVDTWNKLLYHEIMKKFSI